MTTTDALRPSFSFVAGAGDIPDWVSASIQRHADALRALIRQKARSAAGLQVATQEQTQRVADRLLETVVDGMTAADLEGRADVLRSTPGIDPRGFEEVPHVPFGEAVKNVTRRNPKLAPNAQAVAKLYRDGPAFAVAKSMDVTITARVQALVSAFIGEHGDAKLTVAEIVRQSEDFTAAYAENVLRTNLTTAQTEGMFSQTRDPNIKAVIPAFQLTVIRDSNVRRGRGDDGGENHLAADGLVASVDDSIWMNYAPPFGYNCRCRVVRRTVAWLKRNGLLKEDGTVKRRIPSGIGRFQRHPNFGRSRVPGG